MYLLRIVFMRRSRAVQLLLLSMIATAFALPINYDTTEQHTEQRIIPRSNEAGPSSGHELAFSAASEKIIARGPHSGEFFSLVISLQHDSEYYDSWVDTVNKKFKFAVHIGGKAEWTEDLNSHTYHLGKWLIGITPPNLFEQQTPQARGYRTIRNPASQSDFKWEQQRASNNPASVNGAVVAVTPQHTHFVIATLEMSENTKKDLNDAMRPVIDQHRIDKIPTILSIYQYAVLFQRKLAEKEFRDIVKIIGKFDISETSPFRKAFNHMVKEKITGAGDVLEEKVDIWEWELYEQVKHHGPDVILEKSLDRQNRDILEDLWNKVHGTGLITTLSHNMPRPNTSPQNPSVPATPESQHPPLPAWALEEQDVYTDPRWKHRENWPKDVLDDWPSDRSASSDCKHSNDAQPNGYEMLFDYATHVNGENLREGTRQHDGHIGRWKMEESVACGESQRREGKEVDWIHCQCRVARERSRHDDSGVWRRRTTGDKRIITPEVGEVVRWHLGFRMGTEDGRWSVLDLEVFRSEALSKRGRERVMEVFGRESDGGWTNLHHTNLVHQTRSKLSWLSCLGQSLVLVSIVSENTVQSLGKGFDLVQAWFRRRITNIMQIPISDDIHLELELGGDGGNDKWSEEDGERRTDSNREKCSRAWDVSMVYSVDCGERVLGDSSITSSSLFLPSLPLDPSPHKFRWIRRRPRKASNERVKTFKHRSRMMKNTLRVSAVLLDYEEDREGEGWSETVDRRLQIPQGQQWRNLGVEGTGMQMDRLGASEYANGLYSGDHSILLRIATTSCIMLKATQDYNESGKNSVWDQDGLDGSEYHQKATYVKFNLTPGTRSGLETVERFDSNFIEGEDSGGDFVVLVFKLHPERSLEDSEYVWCDSSYKLATRDWVLLPKDSDVRYSLSLLVFQVIGVQTFTLKSHLVPTSVHNPKSFKSPLSFLNNRESEPEATKQGHLVMAFSVPFQLLLGKSSHHLVHLVKKVPSFLQSIPKVFVLSAWVGGHAILPNPPDQSQAQLVMALVPQEVLMKKRTMAVLGYRTIRDPASQSDFKWTRQVMPKHQKAMNGAEFTVSPLHRHYDIATLRMSSKIKSALSQAMRADIDEYRIDKLPNILSDYQFAVLLQLQLAKPKFDISKTSEFGKNFEYMVKMKATGAGGVLSKEVDVWEWELYERVASGDVDLETSLRKHKNQDILEELWNEVHGNLLAALSPAKQDVYHDPELQNPEAWSEALSGPSKPSGHH
ncbi:hypothetical protein EV360DRAFT_73277 [Lentinula raphanica]|nr:hypothetical protein EV360DRAFT_73277 [Lentinula raphanica]